MKIFNKVYPLNMEKYRLLRPVEWGDVVSISDWMCPICGRSHDHYYINVPVFRTVDTFDLIRFNADLVLCLSANKIKELERQVNDNNRRYQEAKDNMIKEVKLKQMQDKIEKEKKTMTNDDFYKATTEPISEDTTPKEQAHSYLVKAQDAIDAAKKYNDSVGSLSDGYHTFDELYHHRAMLFAALCLTTFKNCAWKSLLHNDPKEPMYNGMFIVGIDTPFGQASYHYDIDPYWAIFKVKELDRAPKFDGHTPDEAIDRIFKYAKKIGTEPVTRSINISDPGFYNIEPQLQYVNEVDTTGTPIMRTGINISTTKKDDHNSTTLK